MNDFQLHVEIYLYKDNIRYSNNNNLARFNRFKVHLINKSGKRKNKFNPNKKLH